MLGWIILGVIAVVGLGIYRVKRKVEDISGELFGTKDIAAGLKLANEAASELRYETPKSVAAMTSIVMPNILKDFPDFNYDEWSAKSQNILKAYIEAINSNDDTMLNETTLNADSDLRNKLKNRLRELESNNEREKNEQFRIHRTEISNYTKHNGRCIITFQSSVQSKHYIEDVNTGDIIDGQRENWYQTRYEVSLIYIQDRTGIEGTGILSKALNCPNCGAVISNLGNKVCEYCGTGIVEYGIQAWFFGDIREI